MKINNTFILVKKTRIFLELFNIGFGIGISINNNIFILNLILFISLSISFIEQLSGIYCVNRYIKHIDREFRDIEHFQNWEKNNLIFSLNFISFYLKQSAYLLISLLTIKFFTYFDNILSKIYYSFIILQVLSLIIYKYIKYELQSIDIDDLILIKNDKFELKKIGIIDEECSICLDKNNIEWVSLPCEHKFHENCLSPWIYTNLNCPICRRDFRKK